MGAEVRPATPQDARAIAEVRVASWRWAYRGLVPDDVLAGMSVAESEAGWRGILADPAVAVFVASLGDRLVGFASCCASRDADAPPGTGEIGALYVVEEVAGTGVGSALMTAAEGKLRSSGHVRATLWVLASNDRGRGFYERRGWRWDGSTGTHHVDCAGLPVVRYARPF